MRSYVEDCRKSHDSANDITRAAFRRGYFGGGFVVTLMGIATSGVAFWAGIPMILCGIGVMLAAAIYYRPIKKKR